MLKIKKNQLPNFKGEIFEIIGIFKEIVQSKDSQKGTIFFLIFTSMLLAHFLLNLIASMVSNFHQVIIVVLVSITLSSFE